MDEQTRISTYKESLRIKYAQDLTGLRRKISELHDEAEASGVVVTSHTFENGGASGELVLEPLAKLNAAIALLKELDPDNAAAAETVVFADFRDSCLDT